MRHGTTHVHMPFPLERRNVAHEIFGVVRSISAFRLTGGTKDFLVVGTDSGKITILEYLPEKNVFGKVHQETFGKSGCRRIVPGQHLAADPKGRAVMIGALEKQKLVYILNRDAEARLTISSPLDAHKVRGPLRTDAPMCPGCFSRVLPRTLSRRAALLPSPPSTRTCM